MMVCWKYYRILPASSATTDRGLRTPHFKWGEAYFILSATTLLE